MFNFSLQKIKERPAVFTSNTDKTQSYYFQLPSLLNRKLAVDPPVVTGEAITFELLQPNQSHAVGVQPWDPLPGRPAQVHPVEAEATLEADVLVGVGLGVPCVTALLGFSQLLPQVTDGAGNSHHGHLGWNKNLGAWDSLSLVKEL